MFTPAQAEPFDIITGVINADELLFSVDENNNPIDPQPRKFSHDHGIWHRACHVWIVGKDLRILCQQRSLLKDSNPGRWEPFFGGHLGPGQDYSTVALTEVREELGLLIDISDLRFFDEYKYTAGTEYQAVFVLEWDGEIAGLNLEKEEVQQVAWRSLAEVRRNVVEEQKQSWTFIGYEQDLLCWLPSQF